MMIIILPFVLKKVSKKLNKNLFLLLLAMGSIDPSIPPFRYTLAASPDGEIWDHTDDTNKFQVSQNIIYYL